MSSFYKSAFTDLNSTVSFGGGGSSKKSSKSSSKSSAKGIPPSSPILGGPKSVPGSQSPLDRWQDSIAKGFTEGTTGGGGGGVLKPYNEPPREIPH